MKKTLVFIVIMAMVIALLTTFLLYGGLMEIEEITGMEIMETFSSMWRLVTVSFALILILSLLRVKTLDEKKAGVYTRFGKYVKTLDPGLHIFPVWGEIIVMDATEISIPLYQMDEEREEDDEEDDRNEEMWIDFPDGSLKPLGAKILVEIYKKNQPYDVEIRQEEEDGSNQAEEKKRTGSYRAAFKNKDWESFRKTARMAAEGFIYNYLSDFESMDDALKKKGRGFNLVRDAERDRRSKAQAEELRNQLRRLGYEVIRITVSGYRLDPETKKARRNIQIARRKKEAEEIKKLAEKEKGKGLGDREYEEMKPVRKIANLFQNAGYPKPLERAIELFKLKKAAENGQLYRGEFSIEGSQLSSIFAELGISRELAGKIRTIIGGEASENDTPRAGFVREDEDEEDINPEEVSLLCTGTKGQKFTL